MKFVSVLEYEEKKKKEEWGMPGFLVDLNLDQVIAKIQNLSSVPVKKYYYQLPEDARCEDYRRAIYADVKKEEVNRLLTEYADRVAERKEIFEKKQKVRGKLQRAVWHVSEMSAYCETYIKLYEELSKADIQSEGLQKLCGFLKEYVLSDGFVSMKNKARALQDKLDGLRIKLVFEHKQILVLRDTTADSYEQFLHKSFPDYKGYMKSPFSGSEELSGLEKEVISIIDKENPDFFEEVRKFYKAYQEYENSVLLQLEEEISYYLSYFVFQKKMELEGLRFTAPTVDENKDMSACGLYDLALACANLKDGKSVVSNDMYYAKEEQFFVLTGPNQGGKTTFARSLGQLVYLSKMGFDVPASAANVHRFSAILCHFSVEESVETGRGKLMDELVRLKPMMQAESRNGFVIINELFTTAANYDACIMGKKVLEHFIKQGCRGIYVTHLRELTDAHENVVSIRAMLDENKIQTFQICRKEAEDIACAMNQVNKYHLTYEQLKERLG